MPDEALQLLKPSDCFASALIVSTGFRICCRPRPRRRSSCRFRSIRMATQAIFRDVREITEGHQRVGGLG